MYSSQAHDMRRANGRNQMAHIEFEFEELQPRNTSGQPISGILLYGIADLESSRDYDPHDPDLAYEFYVSAVTLEGGNTVTLKHAKAFPNSVDAFFFNAIAFALEGDDDAQKAFNQAVEDEAEDAECARGDYLYEMMKERELG
jgi:hypothetical protein